MSGEGEGRMKRETGEDVEQTADLLKSHPMTRILLVYYIHSTWATIVFCAILKEHPPSGSISFQFERKMFYFYFIEVRIGRTTIPVL